MAAWRYEISLLVLKNISRVSEHPKRNFVSPCGHVISSIKPTFRKEKYMNLRFNLPYLALWDVKRRDPGNQFASFSAISSDVSQIRFLIGCFFPLGLVSDQTFAREAKCWMKMFDLDHTWEVILKSNVKRGG